MSMSLERLLWRFRAHRLGSNEIGRALEKEIDRCVEERERLPEIELELLRRFGQEFLDLFDRSSEEALRQLGVQSFDRAVDEVRKTKEALETLRRIIAAYGDHEGALRGRDRLVEEFRLESMCKLPLIRILDRLLSRSQRLLDERSVRKASFVARLCHRLVCRLKERGGDPTAILERLNRLEREVEEASNPQWMAEGLRSLRCLATSGYTTLTETLVDEWEIEHWGWRTRAGGRLGVDSAEWQRQRLERIRGLGEKTATLETRIARWLAQPSRHLKEPST